MTDTSSKKLSTLSLNKKQSDASQDKPRTAGKTGARAHQKARLTVEQLKQHNRNQKTLESSQRPNDAPQKPSGHVVTPAKQRRSNQAKHLSRRPGEIELFSFFASCPRGLEAVLAEELIAIGLDNVGAAQAGCHFTGNWQDGWRANLYSRIATRILARLAHAPVRCEDDIRRLALATDWQRWFGAEHTLRVDTSAIRSPMKSLQYCNLLVKDAICDRLRDAEGQRPSIDTVRPDARVHLFLTHDSATLYLDMSGESLFKRGWRLDKAEAPIRENLAAGMLALSGWTPEKPLMDPFCGSGTILIEAAWMALNIPPGINRPFAFERLRVHDREGWQNMREEATQAILPECNTKLTGSDISVHALDAARANAKRAHLPPGVITWEQISATNLQPNSDSGLIVTNPPYGERLELDNTFMQQWASQLKHHYAGWTAFVISADLELPSTMRLKAKRRTPLFNGALECRLFMFDMVASQYTPRA
jgi:putative N6-adenine-specific DNA methylase